MSTTPPQTLADVRAALEADTRGWKPAPRRQMRAALERAGTLLQTPLAELPAREDRILATIDANLGWASDGFASARAFRDWRGRVARACRETTPSPVVRFTTQDGWRPAWRTFFDDLEAAIDRGDEAPWTRRAIAHLASFANARGLDPGDVDDRVLADLLEIHHQAKADAAAAGRKTRDHARKAIDAARCWNRCVRAQNERPWFNHLPARILTWPGQRQRLNPRLDELPECFQADVAAYLDSLRGRAAPVLAEGDELPTDVPPELASPDTYEAAEASAEVALTDVAAPDESDQPTRGRRKQGPLSDATIRNQRQWVLQAAGALIRRGVATADQLGSLRDVCTYPALAHALNDYRGRQRQGVDAETRRKSASAYHLAECLCTIAERWCVFPDGYVARMRHDLRDQCKTESVGTMSVGRRTDLEQFDEVWALIAWFDHPRALFERAERRRKAGKRLRPQDIADVETAIVCRILGILPVRRRNVAQIRHAGERPSLQLRRHRRETSWLFWQPDETKNNRYLRAEIDRTSEPWIRVYLEHYRPAFLAMHGLPDTDHLFPGTVGAGHRDPARLGDALSKRMREVGLRMSLHLARHVAAKLLVDDDPRNDTVAADLLGDDVKTVRLFYLENRSPQASAVLRDIVQRRSAHVRREWIGS